MMKLRYRNWYPSNTNCLRKRQTEAIFLKDAKSHNQQFHIIIHLEKLHRILLHTDKCVAKCR